MEKNRLDISAKRIGTGLNPFAIAALPLVKNILARKGAAAADILVFWNKIAGEELAGYTFPQKLTFKKGEKIGGVLEIAVPGGGFALEVQHREPFIIERINSYFGCRVVDKLKIVQDIGLTQRANLCFNQPEDKKTLVSGEEQNYIEDTAEGVNDDKLRQMLVRLGNSIFKENNKQVKDK